jgi:5-methylcytosine-specific restriction endonuclease McrA
LVLPRWIAWHSSYYRHRYQSHACYFFKRNFVLISC